MADNSFYIGLAYALTWLVLAGYYVRVAGAVRQAERDAQTAATRGREG